MIKDGENLALPEPAHFSQLLDGSRFNPDLRDSLEIYYMSFRYQRLNGYIDLVARRRDQLVIKRELNIRWEAYNDNPDITPQ